MLWVKIVVFLLPSWLVRLWVKRYAMQLIAHARKTPYFDLPGYMERWWLFKDKKFLGATWSCRVHRILRSDLDRHLHDHPYFNVSVILEGCYWEEMFDTPERRPRFAPSLLLPQTFRRLRLPGDIVVREAEVAHRLDTVGPVWTLWLVRTDQKRAWGFHTQEGWVHWKEYLGPDAILEESHDESAAAPV